MGVRRTDIRRMVKAVVDDYAEGMGVTIGCDACQEDALATFFEGLPKAQFLEFFTGMSEGLAKREMFHWHMEHALASDEKAELAYESMIESVLEDVWHEQLHQEYCRYRVKASCRALMQRHGVPENEMGPPDLSWN